MQISVTMFVALEAGKLFYMVTEDNPNFQHISSLKELHSVGGALKSSTENGHFLKSGPLTCRLSTMSTNSIASSCMCVYAFSFVYYINDL